jgi:hypothetical protein
MKRWTLGFGVLFTAVLLSVLPAAAQWIEPHKLTASDAAGGDEFGFSVAVSGNTAIVGVPADDDAGSQSGSAYLFDVANGNQLRKLTASDPEKWDGFGRSVAISGNRAIVGTPADDGAVSQSGSAFLFDVANGNELFKLTASDAAWADEFGRSVAISGNRAIVGAYYDDDAGWNSGSAYLFDVTTGEELLKLTASDGAVEDVFGWSVAISGNRAIVGAYYDDDVPNSSGSAYLFDVTTGEELFKLTASDAASADFFGFSVAISGNTAIVGAFGNDDADKQSGSAYLFDVATGNELFKLTASDAARVDRFGRSVAISGNTAIVGSYRDDDAGGEYGSAYLFDVTTGEELFKLTASDAGQGDLFGWSVAISGNSAIVGAIAGKDDAGIRTGSAYLFIREPSTLSVDVDIKPGTDPNSVNLKSNGVLPVSILTTDEIDALTVDLETLLFGDPLLIDGGNTPVGPIRSNQDDVNDDGLLDLALFFSLAEMVDNGVLGPLSEEAILTGMLLDGTQITGSDLLRIMPKSKGEMSGVFDRATAITAVPEPSTLALLSMGTLALLAYAWRRRWRR